MKSLLTAVAVAASLGLATVNARAQESGPIGSGGTVPAVQPAGTLTLEQLGRLLGQLGYNPKPYHNQAGKLAGYDLSFASNGWTMRLSLSVSKSGTNIWLNSTVGRVVDPAGVPSSNLLKLFAAHNRIWPCYVYFYGTGGYLRLAMPIKNGGVTQTTLKRDIDAYATRLREMITLFKSAPAAPVAPPIS